MNYLQCSKQELEQEYQSLKKLYEDEKARA